MMSNNKTAQSTIEFTFGMIVIVFLIYGMVRVFFWVGMDLANRRMVQDNSMTNGIDAELQLAPAVYRSQLISAVYNGTVSNGDTTQ